MIAYRVSLLASFLTVVLTASPSLPCTQGESEEKVRDAIAAMDNVRSVDRAKADAARRKLDAAIDEALKPSSNSQSATDRLCKAMDEVLADLRR